jgi:hypothetical protein
MTFYNDNLSFQEPKFYFKINYFLKIIIMSLVFPSKPLECNLIINKTNMITFLNASFLMIFFEILRSFPQNLLFYNTYFFGHHVFNILYFIYGCNMKQFEHISIMLIPRFNKITQLDIVHKPCFKIFLMFKIMIFLPYWC